MISVSFLVHPKKQVLQSTFLGLHKHFKITTCCRVFTNALQIVLVSQADRFFQGFPRFSNVFHHFQSFRIGSDRFGSVQTWESDHREVTMASGTAAGLGTHSRSPSCARAGSARPQLPQVAPNHQATWPNLAKFPTLPACLCVKDGILESL